MTTKNGINLQFTLNNLTSATIRVYAHKRAQVARPERTTTLDPNGLILARRHFQRDPYSEPQANNYFQVGMWSWQNIECPGDALLTFVARTSTACTVVAEFVILKGVAGVSIQELNGRLTCAATVDTQAHSCMFPELASFAAKVMGAWQQQMKHDKKASRLEAGLRSK